MAAEAGGRRAQRRTGEHLGEHRRRGLSGEAPGDLVAAPAGVQDRGGHAPGLARRAVAAGQAQRAQVAEANALAARHPQQLAAPGLAVGAEADPVERQAEHRARVEAAVLGEHRADVGVVVLHADRRHVQARGERAGDAGGVEVGVEVVGDRAHGCGRLREQGQRGRLHRAAGVGVVEVAEVGAELRAAVREQACGVLEPSAEGEDGQGVGEAACGDRGQREREAGRGGGGVGGKGTRPRFHAGDRSAGAHACASAARRARAAASPASIQAIHSSRPSPVVAEVRSTRRRGFTRSAKSIARPASKAR